MSETTTVFDLATQNGYAVLFFGDGYGIHVYEEMGLFTITECFGDEEDWDINPEFYYEAISLETARHLLYSMAHQN